MADEPMTSPLGQGARFAAAKVLEAHRDLISTQGVELPPLSGGIVPREQENEKLRRFLDVFERMEAGAGPERFTHPEECKINHLLARQFFLRRELREAVNTYQQTLIHGEPQGKVEARTVDVALSEPEAAANLLERFLRSFKENDPEWVKRRAGEMRQLEDAETRAESAAKGIDLAATDAAREFRHQFDLLGKVARPGYVETLREGVGHLRRLARGEAISHDDAVTLSIALSPEVPDAAASETVGPIFTPWLGQRLFRGEIMPAAAQIVERLNAHHEYYRKTQAAAVGGPKPDKASFAFSLPSRGEQLMERLTQAPWEETPEGARAELRLPAFQRENPQLRAQLAGELMQAKKAYRMPSLQNANGLDWLSGKEERLSLRLNAEDYRNAILSRKHTPLLALKASAPGREDAALEGFLDEKAKEYIVPIPAASLEMVKNHLCAVGIAEGRGLKVEIDPAEPQKAYLSIAQAAYESRILPLIPQIEQAQGENQEAIRRRGAAKPAEAAEQSGPRAPVLPPHQPARGLNVR